MQGVLGHIALPINDIANQIVVVMVWFHHKKDEFIRFGVLTEGRDQRGFIAIADIVFPTVCDIAAISQWR